MRILGIDPGYAIVGYGAIEYTGGKFTVLEYGALTTDKDMEMFSRLKKIYEDLNAVVARIQPELMAIEELFFNTNTKTAINVAQARGIIALAGLNGGANITEYTPLQVKQAVTGYGRADKQQVQQMTKLLLNLNTVPKPDDTADALAIAICAAHSCKL